VFLVSEVKCSADVVCGKTTGQVGRPPSYISQPINMVANIIPHSWLESGYKAKPTLRNTQ
jgi:hypothetical protein